MLSKRKGHGSGRWFISIAKLRSSMMLSLSWETEANLAAASGDACSKASHALTVLYDNMSSMDLFHFWISLMIRQNSGMLIKNKSEQQLEHPFLHAI
jgi:hypothetical protein